MIKTIVSVLLAISAVSVSAGTSSVIEQLKTQGAPGVEVRFPEVTQPTRVGNFGVETPDTKMTLLCSANDAEFEEHISGHNGKDEAAACNKCLRVHGECRYQCGTPVYVCSAVPYNPFNNNHGTPGFPGGHPGWNNGFPGSHHGGNNGFPGGHHGGHNNGINNGHHGHIHYGAPAEDRFTAEENALRECRMNSWGAVSCRIKKCDMRNNVVKSGTCVR